MEFFRPKKVFYEEDILSYPQGKTLFEKFKNSNCSLEKISSHNRIPQLTSEPLENFTQNKKTLVLGIRKSLKLIPNSLSANFIVPFTSSGCPAMCLYCYLLCNLHTSSNMRIFVNRDDMLQSIIKKSLSFNTPMVYELGCNSDLVLENTLTGNLQWAISRFGELPRCRATFATKYHMVEPLLDLPHKGNTQIRFSVNTETIISRVELGTSSLDKRIDAANKMFSSGYTVGLNIAPIIVYPGWKEDYISLFRKLKKGLLPELQDQLFLEIIFMTYSPVNEKINLASLNNPYKIFYPNIMVKKSENKLQYNYTIKEDAQIFLKRLVKNYFPKASISYIV